MCIHVCVLVYYAWCAFCGMHCGLVVMSMVRVHVCTCTMYIQNVHVHVCVYGVFALVFCLHVHVYMDAYTAVVDCPWSNERAERNQHGLG